VVLTFFFFFFFFFFLKRAMAFDLEGEEEGQKNR
jgi:hypothetical protein